MQLSVWQQADVQNYLLENSSDHFCFNIKLYDKEAGVASLSIAGHLSKDPFLYQRDIF